MASRKQQNGDAAPIEAQVVDTEVDQGLLRRLRGILLHMVPVRMELHHANGTTGASMVMQWQGEVLTKLHSQGPDIISREVWMQAKDGVQVYSGPQRMVLLAFCEGVKAPITTPFIVPGGAWFVGGEDEDGGGSLDGSGFSKISEKSVIGILAKMLVETHKLSIHGASKMLDTQQRSLDRYASQQEGLFKSASEILGIIGDLKDKTFERDMTREDKQMTREMKKDLLKKGIEELPKLFNLGLMRMTPVGAGALEQLLMQFLQQQDPIKLQAFMDSQTPEAKVIFQQLVEVLTARQNGGNQGGAPPAGTSPGPQGA
jgi:hypothetical protein